MTMFDLTVKEQTIEKRILVAMIMPVLISFIDSLRVLKTQLEECMLKLYIVKPENPEKLIDPFEVSKSW